MNNQPIGPRFLGLCTGRCGSRYLTRLLNEVGIPTLHEKNTPDLSRWAGNGALGEVNGHFVTQLDPWPKAHVWHFARHPQPFVSSLMKFGFWIMYEPAIHPYLRCTGDQVGDSFRYWVDWNRRILEIPTPRRVTFKIEDIDRDLIWLLADSIGVDADTAKIDPVWDEIQEFAEIPVDIQPEVHEMMDLLGYLRGN
jgi:hypothetical protein